MYNINPYNYPNSVSRSYSANLNVGRVNKNERLINTVIGQGSCIHFQDDSAKFLNQYQFYMKGLSGAANKLRNLNQSGMMNNFTVKSSDTEKADVYSESNLRTKADYEVNVQQLAQKQVSKTDSVKSNESGAFTDGTFTISMTGKSKNNSLNVTVDTTGRDNREIQDDIATQINKSDLGLNAFVVEKDGQSYLQVESQTGSNNSFTITGATRFTTTQNAENLKYSLTKNGIPMNDGKIYQNQSNENVKIDGYKISANFKKEGKVGISVGVDTDKLAKATEEFINQYNETVKFLVDNAHRGTGTSRTLDNLMRAPISKGSMQTIGITMEENGLFSLDKEKFDKMLKNNPDKVNDILSDNYSIADGVYQDAQRGLNEPADKLINRDVEKVVFHRPPNHPVFFNYNPFGMSSNAHYSTFFLNMFM